MMLTLPAAYKSRYICDVHTLNHLHVCVRYANAGIVQVNDAASYVSFPLLRRAMFLRSCKVCLVFRTCKYAYIFQPGACKTGLAARNDIFIVQKQQMAAACTPQPGTEVLFKYSDEAHSVKVSEVHTPSGPGVETTAEHARFFVGGGKLAEVGAVDVDTWMDIVAHKQGVRMCTRESYLAKIDSIWRVCPGVPYDNVSTTRM